MAGTERGKGRSAVTEDPSPTRYYRAPYVEDYSSSSDRGTRRELGTPRSYGGSKASAELQTPATKTDRPRPHVCATCQRSFVRLEALLRHKRSHNIQKPFECPQCTRCFARRHFLLRHQQKLHRAAAPSLISRRGRHESTSSSIASAEDRRSSQASHNAARRTSHSPCPLTDRVVVLHQPLPQPGSSGLDTPTSNHGVAGSTREVQKFDNASTQPGVSLTQENLHELLRQEAHSSVAPESPLDALKGNGSEYTRQLHLPGVGDLLVIPRLALSLQLDTRRKLSEGGSRISTDSSEGSIRILRQLDNTPEYRPRKGQNFRRQSSVQSLVSSFHSIRSHAYSAVALMFNKTPIPSPNQFLDAEATSPSGEVAETAIEDEDDENDWEEPSYGSLRDDIAADSEEQHDDQLFLWLDSATTRNSAATVERRKRAAFQAERLLEQRKARNPNDFETLKMMNHLAGIYRKQGDTEGSKAISRTAMQSSSNMRGVDTAESLAFMHNHAVTLYDKGELDAAETLQLRVLESRQKLSGDRHPDTISAMINYAATLYKKKEFETASDLQEKICKNMSEIVGDRDLHAITAMSNYAITLHSQSRDSEAEQLQRHIVNCRIESLGLDHEDAVSAMINHAILLSACGKSDEAVSLQARVLGQREAVLGSWHPKTFLALANYSTMLAQQGDLEKSSSIREDLSKRKAENRRGKAVQLEDLPNRPDQSVQIQVSGGGGNAANSGAHATQSNDHPAEVATSSSGVLSGSDFLQSLHRNQSTGFWASGTFAYFGIACRWEVQNISQKQNQFNINFSLLQDGLLNRTTMRMELGWYWLTEARLYPGQQRVRWRCRCGKRLYDDFVELTPGSVERLQQRLNERYSRNNGSANSSGSSGLINRFLRSASSLIPSKASPGEKGIELPRFRPTSDTSIEQGARESSSSPTSDLHLCIQQRGSYVPQLHFLDVGELASDRALFAAMRSAYQRTHCAWTRRWSLRRLAAIRLVQFVLYRHANVGVRATAPDPLCIPPAARLHELHYEYAPAPPDYMPPIGDNELLHLFHHPEHATDDAIELLPLLPRKVQERLVVLEQTGRAVGWGLHFVEAWNPRRIWSAAAVLFVLASLAFGVSWSVLKHDMQTAFAVAGYLTSFLTLLVGAVQVHLEPAS